MLTPGLFEWHTGGGIGRWDPVREREETVAKSTVKVIVMAMAMAMAMAKVMATVMEPTEVRR